MPSIVEPFEARTELRSSSADRVEFDALSGFVGLHFLNHRVEVENVNALRPLAFKNRTHFGFKKPQLPPAHRAGAVDRDRDLTNALAHHSRQIEPCPEVAAVGAHPAIVRRDGVRPVPPQQFAPVDRGLCRSFQSPVESGRNLSRMLGNRRSLVDRYVPLPRLFLSCRRILVRRRRIEHLTDSALGPGSGRFICIARGLLLGIRSIPSWLVLFLLAAAILLGFRFKDVVDLLRAHSAKAVVEKDSLGQAESGVNEQMD